MYSPSIRVVSGVKPALISVHTARRHASVLVPTAGGTPVDRSIAHIVSSAGIAPAPTAATAAIASTAVALSHIAGVSLAVAVIAPTASATAATVPTSSTTVSVVEITVPGAVIASTRGETSTQSWGAQVCVIEQ